MGQLDRLQGLKAEIHRLAREHNADRVYVFGSCARREERPDSDVDFLVDFNDRASLFDQVGLQLALADLLKCKVDVIPSSSLADPDFGPGARRDMVAL